MNRLISRTRFWLVLSFGVVLVLTGVAFAGTEQGYLAHQESGSVQATVTDTSVVDTAADSVVKLQLTIHNPTAVPLGIEAPAAITGRIDDRVVARASVGDFDELSVPARSERAMEVPLRIHRQSSTTEIAAALENNTFDLSGRLRGSIRDRSIFISIQRGNE